MSGRLSGLSHAISESFLNIDKLFSINHTAAGTGKSRPGIISPFRGEIACYLSKIVGYERLQLKIKLKLANRITNYM